MDSLSENGNPNGSKTSDFLSDPWRQPGSKYPSTRGLLEDDDVQKMRSMVPNHGIMQDQGLASPNLNPGEDELQAMCEYELFKLQQRDDSMVSEEKRHLALSVTKRFYESIKPNFLGFQGVINLSYSHLSAFLDVNVNNVGDPFVTGRTRNQSKFMERAVLDYFAALWRAEWPHDVWSQRPHPSKSLKLGPPANPSSYWGFVLSMGCTEGTLYGMWNGRDYLAGKIMLIDEHVDGGSEYHANGSSNGKPEPRFVTADQEPVPVDGGSEFYANGNSNGNPEAVDDGSEYHHAKRLGNGKRERINGVSQYHPKGYKNGKSEHIHRGFEHHANGYSNGKSNHIDREYGYHANGYSNGNSDTVDSGSEYHANGYSNGSSELITGKEFRTGSRSPYRRSKESRTPICFYSAESHYSLRKAMVVLKIKSFYDVATKRKFPVPKGFESWPKAVPSNDDGSINVESLAILVEEFARRGYPALICFNYGTTFKGAYDDVGKAADLLIPIFDKHKLLNRVFYYTDGKGVRRRVSRHGFWFHVDGALGAAHMPFLRMAQGNGMVDPEVPIPEFDFSLRGKKTDDYDYSDVEVVNSIAVSGHKWIGSPFPTGVYMTKSKYQIMPPEKPNYIGTPDTTFAGSRNGLASVVLWDYLSRHSFNDLMEKAVNTHNLAITLTKKLQVLNDLVERGQLHPNLSPPSLWVRRSPLSLGVVFRRPNESIMHKYTLCADELFVDGYLQKLTHAYTMEHVTLEQIERLIEDLCQEGAFDLEEDPETCLIKSRNRDSITQIGHSCPVLPQFIPQTHVELATLSEVIA
ncbi:hypothetical protein R1sor_015323 [Riccia sorocarpa]|uniref:Uncharacterized protein n=1 Tax=Riccia sorocarpa TaxID=122646 RepID=A0ABD3HI37_9MARC